MTEYPNIELTEDVLGGNYKSLCNPYWGKVLLSENKTTADLTTPYCGPDSEKFYAVRVEVDELIKGAGTFVSSRWLVMDHGKYAVAYCRPSDRRVLFWNLKKDAEAVAVRLNEALTSLRTETTRYYVEAVQGRIEVKFESPCRGEEL